MKRFRALLLAVVATLCCSFFTLTEVRHSSPQPALRICTAVVYSCMRQCVLLFHLLTLICVMYPVYRYIHMYSCIMLQLHCGTRPFVPIILGVIVLLLVVLVPQYQHCTPVTPQGTWYLIKCWYVDILLSGVFLTPFSLWQLSDLDEYVEYVYRLIRTAAIWLYLTTLSSTTPMLIQSV